MKAFKSYIIEKLVIDKDTKLEILRNYKEGDIILLISYWNGDEPYCLLALTRVDEIDTEKEIIYTRTEGANYRGFLEYSNTDSKLPYIAVSDKRGVPYIFVPEKDVLKVLKNINDDGNKIDSKMFNNPKTNGKGMIKVSRIDYNALVDEFNKLVK